MDLGYLLTSGSEMPSGKEPFTLSIWEYLPNKYTSENVSQNMFSFGENGTDYDIELNSYSYGNSLRVINWNGTGISVNLSDTELLNNWINLIVISNGDTITFYINGISKGTSSTWSINTGNITIGGIGDDTRWWFRGYLTAARIYDRALTPEEITTLSQEFIPKIEYQSAGTDEFGHSIEYNSASVASCNYFPIPKEGLLLKAFPNKWKITNGTNVSKWGDFEQNDQLKQPIVKTIDGITGINPDSDDALSGTAEALSGDFSFVSKIYIGTTDTSKSFTFIRNELNGVGFGLCDSGENDHLFITHIGYSSFETDINLSIGVHIVAVTYNISNGESKFYVDGKLKYIGNYNPGFTYSSNYYTGEGNIPEDLILGLAVYNRILSKEEIKSFSIKKKMIT